MWELARRQGVIKNLLAEARHGGRGFEATGKQIRLPFLGDTGLDALDRLLDTLTEIRGIDRDGRPSLGEVGPWLDPGGRDVPLVGCAGRRARARPCNGAIIDRRVPAVLA